MNIRRCLEHRLSWLEAIVALEPGGTAAQTRAQRISANIRGSSVRFIRLGMWAHFRWEHQNAVFHHTFN
jgi:hypothetical protein